MSGNKRLAERIGKLVEAGRAAGCEIVWVKAIYDHELLPAPMLSQMLDKGKGAVGGASDSWGADFYEIGPEKGEQVVEKRCYSAFHNTQMDDILRRRDIKSLVMTGVATNVCVESTLREAFFHGYYIVMPPDCVGSANVPLHEATIKSVEFIFGHVPESGQVMDVWLGKASGPSRRIGRGGTHALLACQTPLGGRPSQASCSNARMAPHNPQVEIAVDHDAVGGFLQRHFWQAQTFRLSVAPLLRSRSNKARGACSAAHRRRGQYQPLRRALRRGCNWSNGARRRRGSACAAGRTRRPARVRFCDEWWCRMTSASCRTATHRAWRRSGPRYRADPAPARPVLPHRADAVLGIHVGNRVGVLAR